MEKTLTALTCAIFLFAHARLEAQDTTWYDGAWRACTPNNSMYFRTKVKTDSGWLAEDHYRSGNLQMTGYYAEDSLKTRQGVFRWYDDKGVVNLQATYTMGKATGPAAEFWENGALQLKGNNLDGQRDGTWLAYFKSGKLAGKAEFHAGKQVAVILYHENGSLNKKDTLFARDSQFPGGVAQYTRFLNKTLRYPDSAVTYEIQGTVLVGFNVLKNGKVANLKVVKPVNKYLDAEALRVMRLMPDWEPAILAGVAHDSYKLQPVVFALEAQ